LIKQSKGAPMIHYPLPWSWNFIEPL